MGGGDKTIPVVRLDDAILEQLRGVGGDDLVRELMSLYMTHTPERMRRARQALARGDLGLAAKAIHSLRSSSVTLGAGELAGELAEIEVAAERGDAEQVARRWPEVEDRVAALLDYFKEHLD